MPSQPAVESLLMKARAEKCAAFESNASWPGLDPNGTGASPSLAARPWFSLAAAIVLAVMSSCSHVSAVDEPIKNSECMECHSDKELTSTNSAGQVKLLYVDEAKLLASVHKTNSCASCHTDISRKHPDDNVAAKQVNCSLCHLTQSESYGASVHGIALKGGDQSAATCKDCHDSHEVLPPANPNSPLHFTKLAITCGKCHDQAAADVAESVHGKAIADGSREAATCTDCHSEHKIEQLKGISPLKIAEQVCSKCHGSERLNTKYGLPTDRVTTFFESYHGLAAQYGSTTAANCASCHGVHKILASTDPQSMIHKDHLIATCGKCHPGANEKFVEGKVHLDVAKAQTGSFGDQLNWWVRRLYLWLIFVVIGAMVIHNGLLFIKKVRSSARAKKRPVLRMNLSQRWQHFVLLSSFIVLAITGFALKFPDSFVARLLGSNETFRSWSHRVAGIVLLCAGVYHLCYVIGSRDGRKLLRDFLPSTRDVKDLLLNAAYLLGIRRNKARFGRFGYAEKMEYWAVVWGTIIMGVTGLMIWFKMDVTQWVPRWAVDVATTIHYYEAILACLAIVVWHFYHVIFDPDVYPMNMACWDGRVSSHWQNEEHSLENLVYSDDSDPENDVKPINRIEHLSMEKSSHQTKNRNGAGDFSI